MSAKLLKTFAFIVIGLFFSAALSFSGAALLGAGHGSPFYIYIILAPVIPGYGFPFEAIGWLIWPIVGGLIPWRYLVGVRAIIVALLFANYIGIAVTLNAEGINRAFSTLERAFPIAFPHLIVYLLVQYCCFTYIFGRWRIQRQTSNY